MLKSLTLNNFTAFERASFEFGRHLSVIVGENGSGKTHLLKLAYAGLAVLSKRKGRGQPNATSIARALSDKLFSVFVPEALGHFVRHGATHAEVSFATELGMALVCRIDAGNADELSVQHVTNRWMEAGPVYLPTRELLSFAHGFVSLFDERYLPFEGTWRDTISKLGVPPLRNAKATEPLRGPIESALGGRIETDKDGRYYLVTPTQRLEMGLVAEGYRKLGMLSRLISNGTLLEQSTLFWDEPEANLNPHLIPLVTDTLMQLCRRGLQVVVATHSLFFLREIEVALAKMSSDPPHVRFIGLHRERAGVRVEQGPDAVDLGRIALVEDELDQSARFMEET